MKWIGRLQSMENIRTQVSGELEKVGYDGTTSYLEDEKVAREHIKSMVTNYYQKFKINKKEFERGDSIHYASRVFDEKEMCSLADSMLDFWLSSGRFTERFEREFAKWIGVKYACLVNSGSSANMLAFMALTASELGERRIRRGDEVITVACAFPTTVAPIIQYGAIPVFIDVTIPQYNIDVSKLEGALSRKTKAVMVAHTLGNPFDLASVRKFCDKHNLWLVEDNCDALGAEYMIGGVTKMTGTWGDIGTSSFYPAHHMTMGEGGCVYTDNKELYKILLSFRDWGRDCTCSSGHDNCCGHRYDGRYGELPEGYDHKYVYSRLGYNLKATDMQAAIGCEQLKKLSHWRNILYYQRLKKILIRVGLAFLLLAEKMWNVASCCIIWKRTEYKRVCCLRGIS